MSEAEPTTAVLSLGANLGDPVEALCGAAQALAAAAQVTVLAASSVYLTDPVGGPEQPRYANAVLIIQTTLEPIELLELAQRIEQDWGRVRDVRWGPRTLDIDVISYGQERSSQQRLILPHPRAHERAFVLVPWLEADPGAELIDHGSVAALVAGMDVGGVQATEVSLPCMP